MISAYSTADLEKVAYQGTVFVVKEKNISASQSVQIVRPAIHHGATRAEVLRAIVRSTHGVLLLVRELALNHIRTKTDFIERSRGWTVPGHDIPCGRAHRAWCCCSYSLHVRAMETKMD